MFDWEYYIGETFVLDSVGYTVESYLIGFVGWIGFDCMIGVSYYIGVNGTNIRIYFVILYWEQKGAKGRRQLASYAFKLRGGAGYFPFAPLLRIRRPGRPMLGPARSGPRPWSRR